MLNIYKVIDELRKKNPDGFKSHKHFMIAFGCAIEKAYPNTFDVCINIDSRGASHLVLATNNTKIGIELLVLDAKKYLEDQGKVMLDKDDSVIEEGKKVARVTFWKIVEYLEHMAGSKQITEGYCVFISSVTSVFDKQIDFNLSDGLKEGNKKHRMLSKEEKAWTTVHIKNAYALEREKYNDKMDMLIVNVKP